MGVNLRRNSATSAWRVFLAFFCILLVMVSGTVQVAHTHADGADTHADCSLCSAAHIIVHLAQTPAAAPPVAVVTRVEVDLPTVLPIALSTFALFTRPPPAAVFPV
jgi:hypothetical protein